MASLIVGAIFSSLVIKRLILVCKSDDGRTTERLYSLFGVFFSFFFDSTADPVWCVDCI